jgi:phytoene dehydrogenase-like protein
MMDSATNNAGQAGHWDVVIVGAGHNGLVAAAYLARAGHRVLVCESTDAVGGATTSVQAFEGQDARLSRYSYLVSLLPDQIVSDLGLRFSTKSRNVASYTPTLQHGLADGLLIRNGQDAQGNEFEIERFTGSSSDARAWDSFYADVARFAQALAPTLLEPLPSRSHMRARLADDRLWDELVENPIGSVLKARFQDDVVRGVVATDALIGTFADLDVDLSGNRCFLYHVVGNGTGEWKVPVGGMGALVAELDRVARDAGVQIRTGATVTKVESDGVSAQIQLADGEVIDTAVVLVNAAPSVLDRLLGREPAEVADGPQLKVNMLLERLPRLKSGIDPAVAFAGTFHINQSYEQLQRAHAQAAAGELPTVLPAEVYCHSLTDNTILGPDLRARGFHTLTLFGLHTPASLFESDNERLREQALAGAFASLNEHLADPIEDCLATDSHGRPCAEAKTPLDLEKAIGLPRGNIFHRELSWPFADEQPGRWGTETDLANVFICGAGAIRGGGVSGIPGHNAAKAALARLALSRN